MQMRQVEAFIEESNATATDTAAKISAAFPRYFVRTPHDGTAMLDENTGKPIETDDIAFAMSARYNCQGTVIDRWHWKY